MASTEYTVKVVTLAETAGAQAATKAITEVGTATTQTTAAATAAEIEWRKLLEAQLAAAAAGNQQLAASISALVAKLEQQATAATAATTATKEAAASAKEAALYTDEQKEAAQKAADELKFYSVETKKSTDTTAGLGTQLGALKKAGEGANQVMTGLSQGGIGGLITAGRGAISVFGTLASGAIGVTFLGAVAAAGAAMLTLRAIVNRNEAEMKKAFDAGAKSAEDYQARVATVTKDSEADLATQLTSVKALADAYREVLALIDTAAKRNQTLTSAADKVADEQLNLAEREALARADTPEARDTITRDFARQRTDLGLARQERDITNSDLAAQVREQNAREALAAAEARVSEAQARARDAGRTAAESTDTAATIYRTPGATPATIAAAQRQAQADTLAAEQARANAARVSEETAAPITTAQAQIEAARTAREEATLRRQALDARRRAESLARTADDRQLDTTARERSRTAGLQDRADLAGGSIDEIATALARGPAARDERLAKLIEQIRERAQAVQGEATGSELEQLVAAVGELAAATQGSASAARAELVRQAAEIRALAGQVKAIRVR